jgi:hypothetical protein
MEQQQSETASTSPIIVGLMLSLEEAIHLDICSG